MNIQYTLDSNTGLMSLKFKENVLDGLSDKQKKMFREHLLPILAMNSKFVLTGSLSLKLLGFEPMDDVGDFDLGLMDTFTEEEYNTLKNFFGLLDRGNGSYVVGEEVGHKGFNPKAHMYPFYKHIEEEEIVNTSTPISSSWITIPSEMLKVDIFNDEIIRPRDIIKVHFEEFELKLVHPSITWSYRMRYALDVRSSTTLKYWERAKKFMDSTHKHYFKTLENLQNMNMRIHEHNSSIEDSKKRRDQLRNLISSREWNMENFLNNIFNEGEKCK